MNIFNSLKTFPGKWSVTGTTSFSPEEIASVSSAKVVGSAYGASVCFFLHNGSQAYIPVSSDSELAVGDTVDLTKVSLITLSKSGESDIQRVK